jgi:signal peptidase I
MRTFFISVLEIVEVVLVALGAVFIIRTFLVQPFLVSGASMVRTFSNGDYVIVDEVTYRFREPERGEPVVFRYPNDETTYFIKRIIGLPGETVELKSGKVVIVNKDHPQGETLNEQYLAPGVSTSPRPGGASSFTLGPNEYFVLGDNRAASYDSRDWGVLRSKEIIGVVRLRLWPPMGMTVFAAPAYQN